MAVVLAVLKLEIEVDPNAIGYKEAGGEWKLDHVIASMLNDTANGATVRRTQVTPSEIKQVVEQTDFNSLGPKESDYLRWIVSGGGEESLDVSSDSIFTGLTGIWGPTDATKAAMIALLETAGTRAEVLFGQGVVVTPGDVGQAANI
jgi:hypothetical protein